MQSLLSRTYYFFIGFTLSLITAGSSYAGTKLDVNIGIYAPFSKQNAFIGRTILGSLEIAREQLKSSSVHYSFYTLDQNIADKNATRTLQKFIKAHQIKVLVTEGVEPGRFVAPMAKKNNLIHPIFFDILTLHFLLFL